VKVKELLVQLRNADPDAEVRYMQIGADETESDSVDEVEVQNEMWTFESGNGYSVYYPGEPEPRNENYGNVEYRRLSVIVLKPAIPPEWRYKPPAGES